MIVWKPVHFVDAAFLLKILSILDSCVLNFYQIIIFMVDIKILILQVAV